MLLCFCYCPTSWMWSCSRTGRTSWPLCSVHRSATQMCALARNWNSCRAGRICCTNSDGSWAVIAPGHVLYQVVCSNPLNAALWTWKCLHFCAFWAKEWHWMRWLSCFWWFRPSYSCVFWCAYLNFAEHLVVCDRVSTASHPSNHVSSMCQINLHGSFRQCFKSSLTLSQSIPGCPQAFLHSSLDHF